LIKLKKDIKPLASFIDDDEAKPLPKMKKAPKPIGCGSQ
jgi:hypothetical protein